MKAFVYRVIDHNIIINGRIRTEQLLLLLRTQIVSQVVAARISNINNVFA
jgi:hypothetical protein